MEGEPEDSAAPNRILLHEYAKSGATDLVLAVLDEKADPNQKSSLGDTALIWGEERKREKEIFFFFFF